MKKSLNYLLTAVLAITLINCGGEKSSSEGEGESDAQREALESFIEERFEYPIPNSYEVTNMLQEANANFVFNITNDPENVSKYETVWQKAMNLGIYGADLSYASTYNRQEETMQFMEASKTLIDDLNITTAFNQNMAERIEANLDNKDSLILIIGDSFADTYNHLMQNGEEKTSLLVIAGSVIEGLHITSQLIISSDYNETLMEVLANQKDEVKELVNLMDAHAEDENVNKVLPTLRYIDLFFDQMSTDGEMTRGQFNDLYGAVKDMRATIIG